MKAEGARFRAPATPIPTPSRTPMNDSALLYLLLRLERLLASFELASELVKLPTRPLHAFAQVAGNLADRDAAAQRPGDVHHRPGRLR
jgi:hypothetical protein